MYTVTNVNKKAGKHTTSQQFAMYLYFVTIKYFNKIFCKQVKLLLYRKGMWKVHRNQTDCSFPTIYDTYGKFQCRGFYNYITGECLGIST